MNTHSSFTRTLVAPLAALALAACSGGATGTGSLDPTKLTGTPNSLVDLATVTPAPGSTFASTSQTFSWTATGADQYALWFGNSAGSYDLGNYLGAATTWTFTRLPKDGRTVYVRIWDHQAAGWQYRDVTYTATSAPSLTAPSAGSVLGMGSQTFTWSPGADEYGIWVGSTVGGWQYGNYLGTATSFTSSRLPVDGSPVYVRFWYRYGTVWSSVDHTFTAFSLPAQQLNSPAPGTTLPGATATFLWSTGATQYGIWAGSAPGTFNYGNYLGTASTFTYTRLPVDGSTVYVRFWYQVGTTWSWRDYTYTAWAPPVSVPTAQRTAQGQLSGLTGLAQDLAGDSFISSSVFLPAKSIGGTTITSAGGGDLLLAKYDPFTGSPLWVKNFGDANDQLGAGVAVTQDGTVAAIGTFLGAIIPGVTNTNALPIDFLLTVDAATGNAIQARGFNENSATVAGKLLSVAANPARNEIAVCGYAAAAATDLVPGATFGGGGRDAVLAVFNSDLTLRWAKQLPGAADEECDAIAIADDGSVFAAGQYNGATTAITALNPGGGAFENPGNAFRKYVWVAKYDVNGAFVAQASFGRGTGATPANGNHKPLSLAVDAAGKLVVGGYHNLTLALGGTSLVSAGGNDGFVAKLDPAAGFAPVWAKRIGSTGADELRGVAVDSNGDAMAVGLFAGTTTGAATLTLAGATDAFVLKLSGSTGATQFGAAYGDTSAQQADRVAINRRGVTVAKDLVTYGGSMAGNATFGTGVSVSTAGPADTQLYMVFATLQVP